MAALLIALTVVLSVSAHAGPLKEDLAQIKTNFSECSDPFVTDELRRLGTQVRLATEEAETRLQAFQELDRYFRSRWLLDKAKFVGALRRSLLTYVRNYDVVGPHYYRLEELTAEIRAQKASSWRSEHRALAELARLAKDVNTSERKILRYFEKKKRVPVVAEERQEFIAHLLGAEARVALAEKKLDLYVQLMKAQYKLCHKEFAPEVSAAAQKGAMDESTAGIGSQTSGSASVSGH